VLVRMRCIALSRLANGRALGMQLLTLPTLSRRRGM
jgi:hypothetical protein